LIAQRVTTRDLRLDEFCDCRFGAGVLTT